MKADAQQRQLAFGDRCIPYTLRRSPRKNLRVVVSPDMSVAVYAPARASARQIEEGVAKKARWIAATLEKVKSFHPLPTPKQYISGETFVYLGRQYRLKVNAGADESVKLLGRFLVVNVADVADRKMVKQRVNRWYREHATAVFARYLATCRAVASRHGIPAFTLRIRSMKRRWGSCAASGRITLNIRLVQVHAHCIEYVIMHELCHLLHHNHGPDFYRLMTRCMPDWRSRKETLDLFKLA